MTQVWIADLSRPLQLELKINLFKDMLRKIPFLQDVGSVVLEELLLRLESRTCMQWDLVVRQGDPGDWMGFISRYLIVYSMICLNESCVPTKRPIVARILVDPCD